MPESYTSRGFGIYAEFRDHNGSKVRIQKSSLAFENCVWIFAQDNQRWPAAPAPHLTVEQAKLVRDALDEFIKESEDGNDEG